MIETLLQRKMITLEDIFGCLKKGSLLYDHEFDSIFSAVTKDLSTTHWTPMRVAMCAADILAKNPDAKILDIGCGPGKFCLIGASLHTVNFFGIDQRLHLLEEGKAIAEAAKISNVEFIHGNMMDLDWSEFNSFYLFNPFLENICSYAVIDDTVSLRQENFDIYVEAVEEKLSDLPVGTRVVTYHGFGGEIPDGYRLETKRKIGTDFLKCWVKERCFISKFHSR